MASPEEYCGYRRMELRLLSVLPTLQVLPSVLRPLEPKLPGMRRRSMVRGELPRVFVA